MLERTPDYPGDLAEATADAKLARAALSPEAIKNLESLSATVEKYAIEHAAKVVSSDTKTTENLVTEKTSTEKLAVSLDYIYPFTTKESLTRGFSAAHPGIDIGAVEGTEIYSICAGTVEAVGGNYPPYTGYGNHVVIKTETGDYILYAHLQEIPPLTMNSTIALGDPIGKVGHTGVSYGSHLHLEVRTGGTAPYNASAVNPLEKYTDLLGEDRILAVLPLEKTTTGL